MAIKFYYIDDDNEASNGYITGFSQNDLIVEKIEGNDFDTIISIIKEKKDICGLILDHKLDEISMSNGIHLKFRGTSIAQEIRNRQVSKDTDYNITDFPIILLSATENIKNSLDDSGKDLFDLLIIKDDLSPKSYFKWIVELTSLFLAYKKISEIKVLENLLSVKQDSLDFRFVEYLSDLINSKPVHVISQFVFKHLILRQGMLINENTLAARLGIDKENSSDWNNVLGNLNEAKYEGVFSEGWECWWMFKINYWWSGFSKKPLRTLSSNERIEIIKDKLQLPEVKPIEKLPMADSSHFWTICKGTNKPIDEIDGLIISGQSNLYPWQEYEYVSLNAAVNNINIENWKDLSPISKIRLSEFQ
jgi:hypothetical protein